MKRAVLLLVLSVLMMPLLRGLQADATTPVGLRPQWAAPSVKALKQVSTRAGAQHESSFFTNLSCELIDYRIVNSNTQRTGCFSETSYGLYDSDDGVIIFEGTDEAVPLVGYLPGQSLVPWPKASTLVSLNTLNTGGTLLTAYRNPLGALHDERNLIGQLVDKKLVEPPDLVFKDGQDQQIVINPQSIAFSENGSWLVAETLTGSFVRINLSTLSVVSFAPAYGATGSPALLKSQVAISGDGHYVAIANDAAGTFKVFDLTACPATSGNCPNYNYQPFVGSQITGLQKIRHLRFVNAGLLSFEAVTSSTTSAGIYELAPTDSIASLIDYLGLGDSYTSGEGAFDYLSGTDTSENHCHLSARSYPLLLTRDLFSSQGGHAVACSGAVIRDIASTADSYRGQIGNGPTFSQLADSDPALLQSVQTNFIPGYISQQRFVGQYQPRIVTVSVGGDDIGFGDIVKNCVMPHLSRHLSDSNCYATYEDRLELTSLVDRTAKRWTALYKQLQGTAPGAHVYAIGYPIIASDTGNCALNAHLGKSELAFAEEMVVYINAAIQKSAQAAGVSYVDISNALVGHRLCETASYNVAVNGLTAGKDGGALGVLLFGSESYHPNAFGQQLIEQAILAKTHNFAAEPLAPAPTVTKVLDVPKSGRTVQTKLPAKNLAPAVIRQGSTISVRATGERYGLLPSTAYIVRLDSSQGVVLGVITTDASGNASGSVMVPAAVEPGGHTIDLTGTNQAGEPVTITQPVYVPVSDNDSDGDGLPDAVDSCPGAPNSGIDADVDGIDDTCDGTIGQPPIIVPVTEDTDTKPPVATLPAIQSTSMTVTNGVSAAISGQTGQQVLGAHTSAIPAVQARTVAAQHAQLPHLPVIAWKRWVVLVVLLWLFIVVLVICVNRLARRSARTVQ